MANVKDAATGTVLTAPSPATSGTSLVLNAGEGARFPTPPFYAVAYANNTIPTASTAEKILVTAVATDTFTIVRTQGSVFTNQSIAVGWRVSNAIFADDLNNASIIKNEVPAGTVNGSNAAFTVASAGKVTGTLEVYKNGIRLKGGGADYTESSTGFTMVTAPASGTVLLVDYIVAGSLQSVGTNSIISNEVPTGAVDGSNTSFTTARAYIANSLEVWINGVYQKRGVDYTETTPGSGIFTMTTAPLSGEIILVAYQYNLNPSSNADTVDGIHASDYVDQTGNLVSDYGGWMKVQAAPTYASASTFTLPGDVSAVFQLGSKLKLTNSGTKYFYVIGSSYAAGTTTVTVTGGSDYSLANAAITNLMVSYGSSPQGHPIWFAYTPTWTGFSTAVTATVKFMAIGRIMRVTIEALTGGTSNATNFKMSLPVTSTVQTDGFLRVKDNTTIKAASGLWEVQSGLALLDLYVDGTGTTWTAAGSKGIQGIIEVIF